MNGSPVECGSHATALQCASHACAGDLKATVRATRRAGTCFASYRRDAEHVEIRGEGFLGKKPPLLSFPRKRESRKRMTFFRYARDMFALRV